jgi:hypothetical protein
MPINGWLPLFPEPDSAIESKCVGGSVGTSLCEVVVVVLGTAVEIDVGVVGVDVGVAVGVVGAAEALGTAVGADTGTEVGANVKAGTKVGTSVGAVVIEACAGAAVGRLVTGLPQTHTSLLSPVASHASAKAGSS